MKKITLLTKAVIIFLLILFSSNSYSQQFIAYQGFRNAAGYFQGNGTSTLQTGNMSLGDSWPYVCINTNGQSSIVSSPSFQTINALEIVNWWDNKSQIIFNEVDLTGYSNVVFSLSYQLDGTFDAGESFNIQYEYRLGGIWNSATFTKNGLDNTTDLQNFGTGSNNPFTFNVPLGADRFRARVYVNNFSALDPNNGDAYQEERYFIDDVKLTSSFNAPEIQVVNNLEIFDNSITASTGNNTDFGSYDVNSGTKNRTYTIRNLGDQNLTILPITVSGSTSFSVAAQPSSLVSPGGETTFTIGFDPNSVGNFLATISFGNNDPNENPFNFVVEGEGVKIYPDTDGDGISDNIDIDDDNDGIRDSVEQLNCLSSSNSSVVENLFLFEDFGSGINRIRINGSTPGVTTTYCFEDGTTAMGIDECDTSQDLNDGKYTVHYSITDGVAPNDISNTGIDIASYAEWAWTTVKDHTPDDVYGRMAIFNASFTPGIFYETEITGILPDVPITYSFWALNIDNPDANFPAAGLPRILPNVTVNFYTTDRSTLLATYSTGDISRCTAPGNGCLQSEWQLFSTSIVLPINEFIIQFVNNAPGGSGNDLALDDIKITQTLCDLDRDGVADIIDLDNDNDGIPNIVEAAMVSNPDPDQDATTNGASWFDLNNNGMNDLFESGIPVDSDGDGIPDYLDLDSDNDTLFDTIEFDGLGDVDVTGNGVGDGTDNNSGINTDDFDGDGILGIVDSNDSDSNQNDHGMNGYLGAIDTDEDGLPDYLDVYNNTTGIYDISTTFYGILDANNDGVIDDTNDADSDGIMDSFDTNDSEYGSPRDLSDKYTLFFDGRNDYIEEHGDILLGLQQATLMGWIKIDDTLVGEATIAGQENFYLQLTNTKRLSVVLNGNAINLTGTTNNLPTEKWIHVAVVFDGLNSEIKLFVNGELKITSNSASTINTSSNKLFRIGSLPTSINGNYFKGQIDEVRIFNTALTDVQLQRMVYQELKDGDFKRGAIIPIDIPLLSASSLIRYYRMDTFKDDIVDDLVTPTVDVVTGAKLFNIKNIYAQTTPLPYETILNGDWETAASWKYGQYWDIDAITRPWSIVHIKNNINTTFNKYNLGLLVDNGSLLKMDGDLELNVSWYLKLDGKIDLQNESQLLQPTGSILDVSSSGSIERDQQGTADNFTYNYYSSPVMPANTSVNNGNYTIQEVLKDGTNPNAPAPITFAPLYTAADGAPTTPITLSTYWIWKFTNLPNQYSNWIQIRHTGNLNAGEGFTMKGPNTGGISDEQNYVFEGKPNNGAIALSITANNIYLVGNPYPSALNARQFILDNPDITGTLKFWEHWGGGSHLLAEYQGGYALLNLSGSVVNASYEASDPLVSGLGTPTKTPQPAIPVAQGFFVEAATNGTVHFNNGQREFVTEASGNSVFIRTASNETTSNTPTTFVDDRMKIRVGYRSPGGIRRQLLLTVDTNTTFDYDNRYDGKNSDVQFDDLNWRIGQEKYIIQGVPAIDDTVVLPFQVKTRDTGMATVSIDDLENIPNDKKIYLMDNLLGIIHDIKSSDYTTTVYSGIDDNRFELVFQNTTLSNDDFQMNGISLFFNVENQSLQINNLENKLVETVKLFNIIGQEVFQQELNSTESVIQIPVDLSKGVYIVNLKTEEKVISKKIIIQ